MFIQCIQEYCKGGILGMIGGIAAGIVVFNAEKERLEKNISRLKKQVKEIYIYLIILIYQMAITMVSLISQKIKIVA